MLFLAQALLFPKDHVSEIQAYRRHSFLLPWDSMAIALGDPTLIGCLVAIVNSDGIFSDYHGKEWAHNE